MPIPAHGTTPIHSLRYRDARAMIDWLCRVFDFEQHAVYDDDAGGVAHAKLVHGNGMLMLELPRHEGHLWSFCSYDPRQPA